MAAPTVDWNKVLLHPLGLAGYVLFLLFGLLSRVKSRSERRWILPTSLIAACIALLGGIGLAYRDVQSQASKNVVAPSAAVTATTQQQNDHPQQSSTGPQSSNVQGVQGDVNINYGATPSSEKPIQPSAAKKDGKKHQ